jgi:hypothetical protein
MASQFPVDSPESRPPIAVAMEWVSRVLAISLEMVLPGLFGQWLDGKLGTRFLVLIGFGLGISLAIWHLTRLGKTAA